MNIAGIAVVFMSLAGAPSQDALPPVELCVWAVEAQQEAGKARHFDAGLEAVRPALEKLPYTTFRKVYTTRTKAPFEQETRCKITSKYTLILTPLSREKDGRIRADLRVEMLPAKRGGAPVKALATRLALQPGQKIKLQGLKLDKGELIILLSAK